MSARILYIDDEKEILCLASNYFDDENLSLETAFNFEDALTLIRKNKYDLIISDAIMPSGSGLELIKMIRLEKLFTGKVILVTGDIQIQGHDKEFGYDLILYKPIDFEELINTVKTLLIK